MLSLAFALQSGVTVIESGTTIAGRYDVVCKVGGGQYGEVFKARVRETGQLVAVKAQLSRTLHSTTEFRDLGDKLVVDLENLKQLQGIHGVPAVHDEGGSHEGRRYFVMEYIDGKSLLRLVESIRPVGTRFAASVMAQLCGIVEQVHRRGYLHCDIKLENVVVRRDGSVWLLDFGSAVEVGDSSELIYCTPGYAPPEHFAGAQPTTRRDVYALGAMLFEMCVLHLPYAKHGDRPRRHTPQFPGIPLENMEHPLCRLGLKMVAFEAEQRPDLREILAALEPMLPRSGDRRDPRAPHPDPTEWYRYGRHLSHRAS
jgi:serine/threonine-protein kinase